MVLRQTPLDWVKKKSGEKCAEIGVINTITALVSAWQVNIALKLLLREQFNPNLFYFNLDNFKVKELKIKKRKDCPTCNGNYLFLNEEIMVLTRFCSSGKYLVTGRKLKPRTSKDLIIFKDGRMLIKAQSEEEAKKKYENLV